MLLGQNLIAQEVHTRRPQLRQWWRRRANTARKFELHSEHLSEKLFYAIHRSEGERAR